MTSPDPHHPIGPWNPGIQSQIPVELLPASTMFRTDNVTTSLKQAQELSDFTGLASHRLVRFRAERLVVHELLIRVMADLSVPDGKHYEDLGINFRAMTTTILERFVEPALPDLCAGHEQLISETTSRVHEVLSQSVFAKRGTDTRTRRRGLFSLFRGAPKQKSKPHPGEESDALGSLIDAWTVASTQSADPLESCIYDALSDVANAIAKARGRLVGDAELITAIVVTMVGNKHGSFALGEALDPIFGRAVTELGYQRLPAQERPVVMNVKGASAAGKSTLRPQQKKLAQRIGVEWSDFALISPDIWRKFLLDYDSLGPATKYAGSLTGHEVEIIDKKLDRYMADKADRKAISHLLIDRFRFDSFSSGTDGQEGGRLLTRFGDLVYMFFLITPPEDTVERAYKRGLEVGRFKAVDDLLDHNVEAYSGMPQLFFTWAMRDSKRVHYEFLDNSVPLGKLPRTVAFGWNGEMNVLDIKCLMDVDRYRRINIDATSPDEVYKDAAKFADENNTAFLEACVKTIPTVNFADAQTGDVYARLVGGAVTYLDQAGLARATISESAKVGLETVIASTASEKFSDAPERLDRQDAHTLGTWGHSAPSGD